MTPRRRAAIFARLKAANPEPRTELEYSSPFQLLVAVMLSAQATDRSVNRATAELFRVAPDAPAMLALGVAGLSEHIRSIGLFNTKARTLDIVRWPPCSSSEAGPESSNRTAV